jgi:hypothetical protein
MFKEVPGFGVLFCSHLQVEWEEASNMVDPQWLRITVPKGITRLGAASHFT